jgi:photosystem II stability/assembly factor-like uncharacterized protein
MHRVGHSFFVLAALGLLVTSCSASSSDRPSTTAAMARSSATGSTARHPSAPTAEPEGIAFWDARNGLMVETLATATCVSGSGSCPDGLIERTTDGGQSWTMVDRLAVPLDAVAVAPRGVAWVTSAPCYDESPNYCVSRRLFVTSDGGASWRRISSSTPVNSVSAVSAEVAWAVATVGKGPGAPVDTTLVRTTDGGRRWLRQTDPCERTREVGLWAVQFATASSGSVLCVGQPATDFQPKALFTTTDGGATWQLRSECLLGASRRVGELGCTGYLPGIQLLADGRGWEWSDRYGLASTSDGGGHWREIAKQVVFDDANNVVSASLVNDASGFILINQPQGSCPSGDCGPRLLRTRDAGVRWRLVMAWRPWPSS